MSLYGMMRTSVSGMQAQANRLSAVADNIANSDTTGYKSYNTHFSQLVTPGVQSENSNEFGSGGVLTDLRQSISRQGTLEYTNSVTDLAINGNGFFVVNDPAGMPFLTRAGSFVPDSEGRLVNSAGMALTGYSLENGPVSAVANGFGGLEEVSIIEFDLIANPSTTGSFIANLPSDTVPTTSPLPSANLATSEFDQKTSLVVYDNLGEEKLVDMYFTNTASGDWEVAVYDQADASLGTGFPYASAALATETLSFDLSNGALTGASANSISFTVPNGTATTIDLAQMSQLAADYTVLDASVNGNPPSPITGVDIGTDGVLHARYGDGSFRELYQIPLATVTSPDRLTAQTGSYFLEGQESGTIQIGFPGNGSFGAIVPSALEQSNVDLASELTTMIQSQRSYTANSKAFQTGSDLLDVLVNLKR
jgi:flagellar hook protein FlgE